MKQCLHIEDRNFRRDERQKPSWYRLTITAFVSEVTIQFDSPGTQIGILPLVGKRTSYLVKLGRGTTRVHALASSQEASANISCVISRATLRDFAALAVRILRVRSTRKIRLPSNDLALLLGGSDGLRRADELALIRQYQIKNRSERLALHLQISDHQCAEFYPNIDDDWLCPDSIRGDRPKSPIAAVDTAIYIHLFHEECWPDFCFGLQKCNFPFDLHISLPGGRADLEAEITSRFPDVHFHAVENHGRDIWPFIQLLQSGVFEQYAAVCKLHSKKSDHLHDPDSKIDIGKRWRRSAILELLGKSGRADRILDSLRLNPSIGIVGPSNLRIVQSPDRPSENDWGTSANWSNMKLIADRLKVSEHEFRTDFFAGTMFWFSPRALAAIFSGTFLASDFEAEPIAKEGTMAHAMERMFNLIAASSGFEVLESRDVNSHE